MGILDPTIAHGWINPAATTAAWIYSPDDWSTLETVRFAYNGIVHIQIHRQLRCAHLWTCSSRNIEAGRPYPSIGCMAGTRFNYGHRHKA